MDFHFDPAHPGTLVADVQARGGDPVMWFRPALSALTSATPFAEWVTVAAPVAPAVVDAAPAIAQPAPHATVMIRWLERWALLAVIIAASLMDAFVLMRAVLPGKIRVIFECLITVGGLDLSRTYKVHEFDDAIWLAADQCRADPRMVLELNDTYGVEGPAAGQSVQAISARWPFQITFSALVDVRNRFRAGAYLTFFVFPRFIQHGRDQHSDPMARIMSSIRTIAAMRGPLYASFMVLTNATTHDVAAHASSTWSLCVDSSIAPELGTPVVQRLQELALLGELAFADRAEVKLRVFGRLFHRLLSACPILSDVIVDQACPWEHGQQFELFQLIRADVVAGGSSSTAKMVLMTERALKDGFFTGIISSWKALPVDERVQKLRLAIAGQKTSDSLIPVAGAASLTGGGGASSSVRALRTPEFVAIVPALRAFGKDPNAPVMEVFPLLFGSFSKPAYLFGCGFSTGLTSCEELTGISHVLARRSQFLGMSMAMMDDGTIPRDLQGHALNAVSLSSFDQGDWHTIPWENEVCSMVSLEKGGQPLWISDDQLFQSFQRLTWMKERMIRFFSALCFVMTGPLSFGVFMDRIIDLHERASVMIDEHARTELMGLIPSLWSLGLKEAGSKFVAQCGYCKVSNRRIPVSFETPMDLTFLSSTSLVFRDFEDHESNSSTAQALGKTFRSSIFAAIARELVGEDNISLTSSLLIYWFCSFWWS
jgi:hypothetical protein